MKKKFTEKHCENLKKAHWSKKPKLKARIIKEISINSKGKIPWNRGLKGYREKEKNNNWKGGIAIHQRGYVQILKKEHPFCNSRGYVMEHRLKMEKKIGRYLKKEEIVHHINGIKTDNRIKNLQLTTKSKHLSKVHKKERDSKGRFKSG